MTRLMGAAGGALADEVIPRNQVYLERPKHQAEEEPTYE
jgi:hypothetical protein